MSIAVVGALREEIAPLTRLLADQRPAPVGRSLHCRAAGRDVHLMAAGDGMAKARRAAEELLEAVQPRVLICLGLAGGLTEDLEVGQLVLADRVVGETSGGVFSCPESRWRSRAMDRGAATATLVSADVIACRRADRRRLAGLANATPAAVDLESAGWAAAATTAGIPFIVLRGISDSFDEELPLDFESLRDSSGSVDRRRVIAAALKTPRALPGLLRLRRRLHGVSRDLATWAAEVVAA